MMDASTSASDSSSSIIIDETCGSISNRNSAAGSSVTSSLPSSSLLRERRCGSEGYRGLKTTKFDKVFIYEFSVTIGNNPAVREGCPIALGSQCTNTTVLDLESFEQYRRPSINKRRRGKELYIPVYDRASLLMSQGFSLENIVETVLEVEEIKKSRQECMKLNGWQKLNYAIDFAGKSIMKKLTNGNSSKMKWSNDKSSTTNLNSDPDTAKGSRDKKRDKVARTA